MVITSALSREISLLVWLHDLQLTVTTLAWSNQLRQMLNLKVSSMVMKLRNSITCFTLSFLKCD